jgi:hypothetical protein
MRPLNSFPLVRVRLLAHARLDAEQVAFTTGAEAQVCEVHSKFTFPPITSEDATKAMASAATQKIDRFMVSFRSRLTACISCNQLNLQP